MNFRHIKMMFLHEWRMDMRNKATFYASILYTVSSIFVCFLSFNAKQNVLHPLVWNALYWLMALFTCLNAITKNTSKESENQALYFYQIISPQIFIVSKIIYNILYLSALGIISFVAQSFVLGNKVEDNLLYFFAILVSMIGFSATLTLVSSIAAKAKNNTSLMAILSFPTMIPLLLLSIKLSKNALDGLGFDSSWDELATIFAIDGIIITVAILLFPFLWKD